MNNQSQSSDRVLKDVSDVSTKKGKFSLLGCGCLSIVSVLGIMIVFAITGPFYISQPSKAKQSEAKQYVGSMNRAQQAYLAENGRFANSVDALGLGIKTETTNYKYSVNVAKKAAFQYGLSKDEKLKSYVGAVFLVPSKKVAPQAGKNEMTTVAILCLAQSPGMAKPANPTNINGQLACGDGTEIVTK
jgi:type IV pilus assembly protein PilA